ncbi:MAG: COG4315 family predicted lipoprotein [Dehalococcoidia bacterium]
MSTTYGTLRRLSGLFAVLVLGAVGAGIVAFQQPAPAARAQDPDLDVRIADGGDLGPILVDRDGFTLYIFTRDEPGTSNCSGNCATVWPPLLTDKEQVAAPEEIAAGFSIIARDDGARQVAYKDMPLYLYDRDTEPGQTNGQGVGDVWFVVAP